MKKRSLVLFVFLMLGGGTVALAQQVTFTYDQLDPDVRQCSAASDCTFVMLQCCSCTLAAVNINDAQAVRTRVVEALACGQQACPISCEGPEIRCQANLCTVDESYSGTPEPQTVGAAGE